MARDKRQDRVLIVSFDALRPDMVTPELMPNLSRFAQAGARFPNARSTFPTETRVNQTALVTGCYPAQHGIVGNRFLDPVASPGKLFNTGDETELKEGDRRLGGRLVNVPVLGEILAATNRTYTVLSAGTPGGTRMLHHTAERTGGFRLSLHRPDATVPTGAIDEIVALFGPIPKHEIPSITWLRYATDVYLQYVEPTFRPDVMVLWYCEPDSSYHCKGIGSPDNLAAIRAVDAEFGRILDWQAEQPPAERLHVVTMSDHGQITVESEKIDLAKQMEAAGFTVGETTSDGADAALVLSSAGGIYVRDSDPALIARMLDWLQRQPWCGPVSTWDGDGALSHAQLGIDHARAPDIGLVLKSNDNVNEHGYSGASLQNAHYPVGGGIHGGLHHVELNAWLVLGGPAMRQGYHSPLPAGLIDVLPTVLHLLGLEVPQTVWGRILKEGLAEFAQEPLPEATQEIHSAQGVGGYRTHLTVDWVGKTRYLRRGWVDHTTANGPL